jgi:hypothetical protein
VRAIIGGVLALALAMAAPAFAQSVVDASAPLAHAVTIYRDPDRGPDETMDRDWPRGFAMITERRQVTLPPGQSTIRFTGVAEGMIAVSAIVTGLPGGPVEQNRDADLLGPAALVDGTLGNRVTLTRTNPATGREQAEPAIIRTRADGGLVVQTAQGFEAVRCSGLPERLTFDRVPDGLSPQPVFSIQAADAAGGTYEVELTYLSWGFDWQAHHVAVLAAPDQVADRPGEVRLGLTSWLTLLNDNGQSFPGAELQVVAGTLNVTSDFRGLASPPQARPLNLTCYPLGSTADSTEASDIGSFPPVMLAMAPPPPPPPPPALAANEVTVTGARIAMIAQEQELGGLRLYRVPEPVTVAAKGQKQIAFLQRDGIAATLVYRATCLPDWGSKTARPFDMRLETVNDREHGLGVALPAGGLTLFEPAAAGDLLVGEESVPDRAAGQQVGVALAASTQVYLTCQQVRAGRRSQQMAATISNAGTTPVQVRLEVYRPSLGRVAGLRDTRLKDGMTVTELIVPAAATRQLRWSVRPAAGMD